MLLPQCCDKISDEKQLKARRGFLLGSRFLQSFMGGKAWLEYQERRGRMTSAANKQSNRGCLFQLGLQPLLRLGLSSLRVYLPVSMQPRKPLTGMPGICFHHGCKFHQADNRYPPLQVSRLNQVGSRLTAKDLAWG